MKRTPKTPAQQRAARTPPPPGDPRHGLNCYTNYRCRCDIGRAAGTAARNASNARRAAAADEVAA